MTRLKGKRALIVGASSEGNMGQVMARRFLSEGAAVTVAGRKQAVLDDFAKENGAAAIACDLTQEDSVNALVEDAHAAMGGIDIAVNATGWGLLTPFLDNTREQLEQMTALQLVGPFQLYQALVRKMTAKNRETCIAPAPIAASDDMKPRYWWEEN